MGIVYLTRNLVNGKIYVGLQIRSDKNYLGSGHALDLAIKKYGRENFERTTIDTFLLLEDGCAKEIFWIREKNSKAPNGYNLTNGGEGVCGYRHTDATRSKMKGKRPSMMGKKNALGYRHTDAAKAKISNHSSMKRPEARAKISAALMGHPVSVEIRAKISAAQRGRKLSPEHRAHIGAAMTPEHRAKISASVKATLKDKKNHVGGKIA